MANVLGEVLIRLHAATAGMSSLASAINSAFTKIGSILGQYVS